MGSPGGCDGDGQVHVRLRATSGEVREFLVFPTSTIGDMRSFLVQKYRYPSETRVMFSGSVVDDAKRVCDFPPDSLLHLFLDSHDPAAAHQVRWHSASNPAVTPSFEPSRKSQPPQAQQQTRPPSQFQQQAQQQAHQQPHQRTQQQTHQQAQQTHQETQQQTQQQTRPPSQFQQQAHQQAHQRTHLQTQQQAHQRTQQQTPQQTRPPVSIPSAGPAAGPTEDPAANPSAGLADPSACPAGDPATDPSAGPAADPSAGPAGPAADPSGDPAADPATDPAPVSIPAAGPTAGPATGPTAGQQQPRVPSQFQQQSPVVPAAAPLLSKENLCGSVSASELTHESRTPAGSPRNAHGAGCMIRCVAPILNKTVHLDLAEDATVADLHLAIGAKEPLLGGGKLVFRGKLLNTPEVKLSACGIRTTEAHSSTMIATNPDENGEYKIFIVRDEEDQLQIALLAEIESDVAVIEYMLENKEPTVQQRRGIYEELMRILFRIDGLRIRDDKWRLRRKKITDKVTDIQDGLETSNEA